MPNNPDDNLNKKTGTADQPDDLDMRHIFNLTDEEAEQLKPTGLITAEDDFGGLLDDEPSQGEQQTGFKQTLDNTNPIYAYENIKDISREQKIDIFPLLLAYQTSQEKDWARFIQIYGRQQGLDKKNLLACDGLLQHEVFPNIKKGENFSQFLDKVTERYKLEVVTLFYDYLENFRKNKERGADLNKLIFEGKDLEDALDRLAGLNLPQSRKDLITFLQKYQQSKKLHPLATADDKILEQNMGFIAKDLFAQGYRPEHFEVAIIAEILGTKFQRDIINQMLDRKEVDREYTMILDVLSEEQYCVTCVQIRDEILKKIMNNPENISTLQKRVAASPEVNNFNGLKQLFSNSVAEELQTISNKQFEYGEQSEEDVSQRYQTLTKLKAKIDSSGVDGLNNELERFLKIWKARLSSKDINLTDQTKQQKKAQIENWEIVSGLLYLKNSVDNLIELELNKLVNNQFEYSVMSEEEKEQRETKLKQIRSASLAEFLDVSMVGFMAQLADSRFELSTSARDKYEDIDKKIRQKIYIPPYVKFRDLK